VSISLYEALAREEARLNQLDNERAVVLEKIATLRAQLASTTSKSPPKKTYSTTPQKAATR